MPDYGHAEAAGAIYVIARAFGFDDVAEAALEAQKLEIDENYGRALDEGQIGTIGVDQAVEDAVEETTPSLANACGILKFELDMHLAREAKRRAA